MNAEEIANEVSNWFPSAVGDMAFEMVSEDGKYLGIDKSIQKKIKQAINDGVQDIRGWLADELYNDEEYFFMIADNIMMLCVQNDISIADVYMELKEISHESLCLFCDRKINQCYTNPFN